MHGPQTCSKERVLLVHLLSREFQEKARVSRRLSATEKYTAAQLGVPYSIGNVGLGISGKLSVGGTARAVNAFPDYSAAYPYLLNGDSSHLPGEVPH